MRSLVNHPIPTQAPSLAPPSLTLPLYEITPHTRRKHFHVCLAAPLPRYTLPLNGPFTPARNPVFAICPVHSHFHIGFAKDLPCGWITPPGSAFHVKRLFSCSLSLNVSQLSHKPSPQFFFPVKSINYLIYTFVYIWSIYFKQWNEWKWKTNIYYPYCTCFHIPCTSGVWMLYLSSTQTHMDTQFLQKPRFTARCSTRGPVCMHIYSVTWKPDLLISAKELTVTLTLGVEP